MVPFDYETYILTKRTVQTREGKPARILCYNRQSPSGYQIVALVTEEDGSERIIECNAYGRVINTKVPSVTVDDLCFVPKKVEFYNVYKLPAGQIAFAGRYKTALDAEKAVLKALKTDRLPKDLKVCKINWEE